MSASKFKFVSPGIFINEIDNSQLTRGVGDIGPVIIGRSERGPALRPVRIESFSDFIEVFGEPIPGGQGGDVWRDGNYTAPTYAAYAAQAYLKNANPITFVRLLGADHTNGSTGTRAGWKVDPTAAAATTNQGAYGILLAKKDGGNYDWSGNVGGVLAGVFYVPDSHGANRLALSGFDLGGTAVDNAFTDGRTIGTHTLTADKSSVGVWIQSDANNEFTIVLREEVGPSVLKRFSISFDESKANYFRKVLNTNPTLTNSAVTSTTEKYFLGESFDREVKTFVSDAPTGVGELIACIIPLSGDAANFGEQRSSATSGSTGWVFSQFTDTASNDTTASAALLGTSALSVSKLFKLHAIHSGDWECRNLKVSIQDIKAPQTEYDKYGSFTVVVRRATDTDGAPEIVEMFSSVNLNPNSPDYIGVRMGDRYSVWNDTERRYVEYGQYQNVSKYFRVEVASDVERGAADPALLPVGFYGPAKFRNFRVNNTLTLDATNTFDVIANASGVYENHGSAEEIYAHAIGVDLRIKMPEHVLRTSSIDSSLSSTKDAYFGIDVSSVASNRAPEDYADLVRRVPDGQGTPGAAGDDTIHSFIFSLEDLVDTGLAAGRPANIEITHTAGSRAGSTSMSSGVGKSINTILDAGYNRFTMPIVGGSDGLDVMEREPFRNSVLSGAGELTHYAFNSVKRSIDSVADPEVVECNIMALPGITNTALTDHMLRVCENRADSLAIIDLEGDYLADTESAASESTRLPSVDTTITNLKARGINSSYGCAYFPWVQMRDTIKGQLLWAPPSIAALGTMGSSARKTELWFAPAGFTRGGLSEGAAGVPVVGVRHRLTSKERDKLYEASINPIASFPSEGIVIFGQKTLQVTPSALDRINVRRLMIFLKKEVSRFAATVLFDQNVQTTWARFTSKVNPFLASVKSRFGLTEYRLILDETTTTPELVDRNVMYAKILLKPARAIEYIAIDFVITDSGASFAD